MASTVQSAKGVGIATVALPVCSLPMSFGYSGANLDTATVIYNGVTYVQTFTYAGDDLINVSAWVPQ